MTVGQAVPPLLRDLIHIAASLGYAEPEISVGDGEIDGRRVPLVRVQLYDNPHRRNVVAHCRVLYEPGCSSKFMERVAIRSALAKALELATDPSAISEAE